MVNLFIIAQTAVLFISAILISAIGALVYFRVPKALINRIFSFADISLGIAALSFGLPTIPVILWEVPGSIFFDKFAYTFLIISLIFFLFSALTIQWGSEIAFRPIFMVILRFSCS